jgi:hypothetical protein
MPDNPFMTKTGKNEASTQLISFDSLGSAHRYSSAAIGFSLIEVGVD